MPFWQRWVLHFVFGLLVFGITQGLLTLFVSMAESAGKFPALLVMLGCISGLMALWTKK